MSKATLWRDWRVSEINPLLNPRSWRINSWSSILGWTIFSSNTTQPLRCHPNSIQLFKLGTFKCIQELNKNNYYFTIGKILLNSHCIFCVRAHFFQKVFQKLCICNRIFFTLLRTNRKIKLLYLCKLRCTIQT